VTAKAPGSTVVTITYRNASLKVPVSVKATVKGDLNGDGEIDIDDVNKLSSYVEAEQEPAGRFDVRDLDGDGKITNADVRILKSLCSRTACATP
jgi:hypothetical protein